MQNAFVLEQLIPASPEIFLALAAMVFLMFGVFSKKDTSDLMSVLCAAALGVAAVMVAMIPEGASSAFNNAFILDPFARLLKILAYVASAEIGRAHV